MPEASQKLSTKVSSRLFPSGQQLERGLKTMGATSGSHRRRCKHCESPSWLSTESLCFNQPTDLLCLKYVGIWNIMQVITAAVSSAACNDYLFFPTEIVILVVGRGCLFLSWLPRLEIITQKL